MAAASNTVTREMLDFYIEAGVDAPIGEEPVDRFTYGATASPEASPAFVGEEGQSPANDPKPGNRTTPSPTRQDGMRAAPQTAPLAPDTAAMTAREMAASAATLEELRAILERFDGCALKTTAKQLVFADGNPQAKIMFVGEAPGRDEDIEGLPFVGRSGKLLDRMMATIGLNRTSAYIANIIPWRPPGNRTPTPQESAICLPFIQRQIELCNPDMVVCLGGPSAQTLLGIKEGITKARGRWVDYEVGARTIRAMPTFHPAYLLRTPLAKRLVWRDLLAIKAALASAGQP